MDLWRKITTNGSPAKENAEIFADFVADKMNRAWVGLEKAPAGSFKNKLHGLGLRLLSMVKPSEFFLKSVSNEVTKVEITYPASLNHRLVRRRVRHIATRGSEIHRKYFYGSVSLIPMTAAFAVLPLPNIAFFWISFRAYSHWKALKGSERLLLLTSDSSRTWSSLIVNEKGNGGGSREELHTVTKCPWTMLPSEDLEGLTFGEKSSDGVSNCAISSICKAYNLDMKDVLKYRDSP